MKTVKPNKLQSTLLVVTAFAPALNARQTLTPQIRTDIDRTELWLIDLGEKRNRLGVQPSAMSTTSGEDTTQC